MKNSELKSKIRQEYANLNDKIRQTSELLVSLVQTQGSAIKLQYTRKEMYLCLIRKNDNKGRCCGVRWAKYQYSIKNGRRSWYNFKLPGKVPASTVRLMSPEGQHKFAEMDAIAVRISSLRHDLTSKKKRIISTFQNIKTTDDPRLQKILEDYGAIQEDADLGLVVQEPEMPEALEETEQEEGGQGSELTETADDPEQEEDSSGAELGDAWDDPQKERPAMNLEDFDFSQLDF